MVETDVNSIIVTVGYILTILGLLSALAVGHYYIRKASGKKKLTRTEFNQGTILFAGAMFISTAGIGIAMLIKNFLEPERESVIRAITIGLLCLALPPLFGASVFILELKGSVEKE